MIKITHAKEVEPLILDETIKEVARKTLMILDEAYGEVRDPVTNLGGFVAIIETESELETLKEYHLDVREDVPEYVDYISAEKENWLVAMFLLSSDYSITVMMPLCLAPMELLKESEVLLESVENYHV